MSPVPTRRHSEDTSDMARPFCTIVDVTFPGETDLNRPMGDQVIMGRKPRVYISHLRDIVPNAKIQELNIRVSTSSPSGPLICDTVVKAYKESEKPPEEWAEHNRYLDHVYWGYVDFPNFAINRPGNHSLRFTAHDIMTGAEVTEPKNVGWTSVYIP